MGSTLTGFRSSYSLRKLWWTLKEKAKTKVDSVGEPAQQARENNWPDTPPPPYATLFSQDRSEDPPFNAIAPSPLLASMRKGKAYREGLFLWYLIEIIAVTFSVDFPRLKVAITKSCPALIKDLGTGSCSILNENHQAGLEELCALVRDLEEKLRDCRWPSVRQQDKNLVVNVVLEPARKWKLDGEYVLEVFGRYKTSEVNGVRKAETLVDYWMPPHSVIQQRSKSSMLDMGDTLTSHAVLIASLKLEERVERELENAMATFQKHKGLEKFKNSQELQSASVVLGKPCCWPLSSNYVRLFGVLRFKADACNSEASSRNT
ncbi:hypothetical protein P154DRAFT_602817 [Amniculicola lignicola CBS 123094]|uniref:Uncharacterized protein n=1 Tax=Amniculicola lignicola CBS 123094 TaxID=1392246 RepID=A0A6A5WCK4_9PLEO|nr:hypothetical protein P154DRAFT_602817 [Amniculicola lignicola CBS 123094]